MIHQDVNPFIPTSEAHAPPTGPLEEPETADTPPSLYQEGIRRSYATLLGLVGTLEATDVSVDHRRNLGEVVARFVEQIVWADQRVARSEVAAINSLIQMDSAYAGSLADFLREPVGDIVILSELPAFLRACVDHEPTLGVLAFDAFETLGLALMASDREIAEEELSLIQNVLGAWRKAAAETPGE